MPFLPSGIFAGLAAVPVAERAVCGQNIIVQFCPWDLAEVEGSNGISGIHEQTSLDSASSAVDSSSMNRKA
ncbi:hypothetical protein VU12_04470 [Desulfobulbus sp. US4]|nr:hypothetical protein [Desulfobulbus sp. US4]